MKREEVRGAERKRERSACESQEVVVIVTESLYLSIKAISGISLLWKKAQKKPSHIPGPESCFVEAKLSANAHAPILATCKPTD